MVHEMKLREKPFESIRSGRKTVELRLFDEKRRKIEIGDSSRVMRIYDAGTSGKEAVRSIERAVREGIF